ncbi:hypothetical protein Vretifemale_13445 [Volvox reticuliferus]|uniref:Uncharacterized protein n=1 Tax=Volvox reticuliferus TaxID=1737510 RepID=A0A8J4CLQ0_9CHLO|nr:hypothetical protein Vretifemale_13445 [Volvox reticuliferus]
MASINFHRPSCTFATTQSLLRAHPHPPQGWNSSPLGLISKICACPGQQKVSHELFAVPTNREQSSSANDSKPQGAAAANHPASHAASPSPPTTSSATPESVSSFKALPPPLSPEVLVSEALSGQLLSNAKRVFPKVAWGPTQLVQVMAWSTALAVVSVTAAATTPQASVLLASDELRSAAVRHLGLETLCCCLTIAVLYMGLRRSKPRSAGLFRYDVSPQLAMTVVALAAVSYPLADPVLYGIWSGVEQAFGLSNQLPDPGVTLVTQLRDASAGGDGVSIAMHVVASCIVGPFWEEVRTGYGRYVCVCVFITSVFWLLEENS